MVDRITNIKGLPTLPGLGLGPLRLGMLEGEVKRLAGTPATRRTSQEHGYTFEVLDYSGVTLRLIDRRLEEIVLKEGYSGPIPGGGQIGMTWLKLKSLYPGVLYDDGEMRAWCDKKYPGMWFQVVSEDPSSPTGWVDEEFDVRVPAESKVRAIFVKMP